ncbi:hypothetical protein FHI69_01265 [Janthinobacterium lividum]|uniref:Uncharacterized protein n=1 Tax=Janthinobacterium lividum TaxID=29581 RepID=A0A5C4NZ56_9BURK|nr:hypothetical protein [Janthinobacterium lividum]TNC77957.1 hypothetical protein FHI69_01265 [Janthinobacterium lividum]
MTKHDDMHQYQYLWDGSQPGWELTHIAGNNIALSLQFSIPGGSARERMSVRKIVEEFKTLPLQQVTALLHGCQVFSLGEFESKEARTIAFLARKEGLIILEEPVNVVRYLPTNRLNHRVLLIEDEDLAKRVYETALLNGLPVRHVEV